MNNLMPNTFSSNALIRSLTIHLKKNVLNSIEWTQGLSHTFGELDHELIDMAILLTSANSIKYWLVAAQKVPNVKVW